MRARLPARPALVLALASAVALGVRRRGRRTLHVVDPREAPIEALGTEDTGC